MRRQVLRSGCPEPSLDPPEPKPHKGWVRCPECGKPTDIDVDFEEQTCEVCGCEFSWSGDEDEEEAERDEYFDAKLHAMRDGD